MQDELIVNMYWQRDENAVTQSEIKYGKYLRKIANNILYDFRDVEESVNETYLKAWNSMPPSKPSMLSVYLGRLTRQFSIDIYRTKNRDKRGGTQYIDSLDELSECVSGEESVEAQVELSELTGALEEYLRSVPEEQRVIFVGRYYFCDSLRDIARYYGFSESKIKSILYRVRTGLKLHLEKEGLI